MRISGLLFLLFILEKIGVLQNGGPKCGEHVNVVDYFLRFIMVLAIKKEATKEVVVVTISWDTPLPGD